MMPVARTFRENLGKPVTTVYQGYLDRLSRWSDIWEYLPLLYDFARLYPGVRVLELGARTGNSTLAFLAGAVEVRGHVTSVDIDKVTDYRSGAFEGLYAWREIPEWTFIQGDDMDPGVQARLPQEVDVLFIDTSHYYDHTLAELEFYVPRVAAGGVVLCHDTRWLPIATASIKQWDGSTPPPVGQAIDDYCRKTGKKWVEFGQGYGMGIIRA
jgi:cephalosporin hydroxylase